MSKESELANKISEYWYKELHGKYTPIFQKQKLVNFIVCELQKLNIPNVKKPVYPKCSCGGDLIPTEDGNVCNICG